MRISDCSADVCSSDLLPVAPDPIGIDPIGAGKPVEHHPRAVSSKCQITDEIRIIDASGTNDSMLFLGTICTIESYDQLSRLVMRIDALDHIVAIFIADQRNPIGFIAVNADVHLRKRVFDKYACRAGKRCRVCRKYTAWCWMG